MLDKMVMDVEQNGDRRQTKWRWTLDEMAKDVERNGTTTAPTITL
jgi:hypothetical protein